MEMAMESGPARLAMIVAAISFAQVMIFLNKVDTFCRCCSWFLLAPCLNYAQTTFLNFTYFLSYNRANLIGAGDLKMLIIVILNEVVCRVFIIGLQSN